MEQIGRPWLSTLVATFVKICYCQKYYRSKCHQLLKIWQRILALYVRHLRSQNPTFSYLPENCQQAYYRFDHFRASY